MDYIILNLEGNYARGKIAQIGAVRVDEKLNVLDTFRMNLEHADQEAFTDAMEKFRLWCGESPLVTWGMDDVHLLEQGMADHGVDLDWMPEVFDAREIYEDQMDRQGRQAALSYAMILMGIKPRAVKSALATSMNMVKVLQNLSFVRGIQAQRWGGAGSYYGDGVCTGYDEMCDYGYELA